jgi:hypothetical protein
MSEQMRISAKKLGEVAMPTFCERCFWLQMHTPGELPYMRFPRIFGDIDRYTKHLVENWVAGGSAIQWLSALGQIKGCIPPPSAQRFAVNISKEILLTGEADAIFVLKDDTLAVCDYKTAFCRGDQDPLYPIYLIQLNAYGLMAEAHKLGKVSSLALIYTEPRVSLSSAQDSSVRFTDGFAMKFQAKIHLIPLDSKSVFVLADRAKKIFDLPACPQGRAGCNDCQQLAALIKTLTSTKVDYAQSFPAAA